MGNDFDQEDRAFGPAVAMLLALAEQDEDLITEALKSAIDYMNEPGPADPSHRIQALVLSAGVITKTAINLWADETGQDEHELATRIARVFGARRPSDEDE